MNRLWVHIALLWMTMIITDGVQNTQRENNSEHLYNPDMNTRKRTLYIVRHAKSNHDNLELHDFDRPLEPKGEKNAATVGDLLKKKNILPDKVICSAALRTRETAKIICNGMGYADSLIETDSLLYACTMSTYLDVIHALDDNDQTVMIVAHNPATTYIVNYLQADKYISDVPTTGIVAIEFNKERWLDVNELAGKLLFFYDPDEIDEHTD